MAAASKILKLKIFEQIPGTAETEAAAGHCD